ncbi:EsaB/YukD family protein [Dictyobacter aurantiacus]|uniref:Ubiquitin-like domain-containing protein n=1 Tax=Dictyobacter aurantiacus TaxID=1936993 RepID=A0A401ZI82_9CHLR|nr:EsaB/YukD family protein [Dictyobacter aurantiacus]GCE06556.1 hypothetical protein KDAU_38850 [Dictyobacter aurantiacus]
MQTLLVTVTGQRQSFDLELPGDIPVSELLPFLLDLCVPQKDNARQADATSWCLCLAEQTTALQPTHTLIDAGIMDGAILHLQTLAALEQARKPKQPLGPRQIVPGPETGGIGVRWQRGDLDF